MEVDILPELSLSSAILQFLDFSFKLMSLGNGEPVDGLPITTGLNEIYTTLHRLRWGLASRLAMKWSSDGSMSVPELRLQTTAQSCQALCEQLLAVVNELQLQHNSPRVAGSFRLTLRVVWKKKEIDMLEGRLEAYRKEMTIVLSIILRQSSIVHELQRLKNQNQQMEMKQTRRLKDITNSLREIRDQVISARMGTSTTIEPHQLAHLVFAISDLAQSVSYTSNVQRFLRTLYFRAMKDRHTRIKAAHEKTFTWIFETKTGTITGSSTNLGIHNWLRSDSGIYWVSGKPASGKSTVMKYLATHPETHDSLRLWAGNKRLIVASYFFCGAGTAMQKSQAGLLQTLLYDIFRYHPDLICVTCLSRWEGVKFDQQGDSAWCLEDLLEALNTLVGQTTIPSKFCFFIDGLDEYTGDHLEIINLFDSLAQSENIKICLSSRPWGMFEDAYGARADHKLYLENLTQDDMKAYIQSEFSLHPEWESLVQKDSRYHAFVTEIAERAQGVFLWLVLVVRLLREGISNGDTLSFLQKRLRRIPGDLNMFFEYMLESLDPIYETCVSHIFTIALTAPEPLPLMVYTFVESELEDENYALVEGAKPLGMRETRQQLDQARRQLDGRYKGLLHVSQRWNDQRALRFRVGLSHRTFRDFLADEMQLQFSNNLPRNFDAHLSLLKAYVATMKMVARTKKPDDSIDFLQAFRDDAMYYARQVELRTKRPTTELLDEIAHVLERSLSPSRTNAMTECI
ncbi:uncharacterized protein BDW43DRAFT_314106 [Aspergillus alliaceus]|uniref:uncharacterized protein n=1 Tax=Petromyces alliaceus TaxID=209559 RepID=UPI0012A75D80|nr:uncharacterized protein BDW43DRAFT_314106 [Aspergillus alliaceus]KAB8230234.1 hypothetical protein BDW43DRAFT_314106 [Aspergillus alliaceus]